jgi:hypothetical protein
MHFGMKLYNYQRNAQVFNLSIYLYLYIFLIHLMFATDKVSTILSSHNVEQIAVYEYVTCMSLL